MKLNHLPKAMNMPPTRAPMTKNVQIPLKIDGKIENFTYKLYQPISGGNEAVIVEKGCYKRESQSDANKLELITGFVDLRNPNYGKIVGNMKDYSDRPAELVIEARHMELMEVLQINLLNPMLENVHVLVWSRDTAEYLKSMNLKNTNKLIIRVVGGDVGLKEQLLYASECLAGKLIAITNQDNTIGIGWDNKDYQRILKEKNMMYALTRHSTLTENPEHGSKCAWNQEKYNNCDGGGVYWGSHDTFVLQARKWNQSLMNELNSVTPDKAGMENLFIWFFATKMHYTVLNPCQVLFVHHHHCVPIRGRNRPRINSGGKSGTAGFTDKLE